MISEGNRLTDEPKNVNSAFYHVCWIVKNHLPRKIGGWQREFQQNRSRLLISTGLVVNSEQNEEGNRPRLAQVDPGIESSLGTNNLYRQKSVAIRLNRSLFQDLDKRSGYTKSKHGDVVGQPRPPETLNLELLLAPIPRYSYPSPIYQ